MENSCEIASDVIRKRIAKHTTKPATKPTDQDEDKDTPEKIEWFKAGIARRRMEFGWILIEDEKV